jgi:hypothetical protein
MTDTERVANATKENGGVVNPGSSLREVAEG